MRYRSLLYGYIYRVRTHHLRWSHPRKPRERVGRERGAMEEYIALTVTSRMTEKRSQPIARPDKPMSFQSDYCDEPEPATQVLLHPQTTTIRSTLHAGALRAPKACVLPIGGDFVGCELEDVTFSRNSASTSVVPSPVKESNSAWGEAEIHTWSCEAC